MLFANSLAVGASIGVAASQTFGQAMVFRILQDFGGSSAWSLGIAAIGDIFFRHEKGAKIGITSIAIVTSPFVGGIIVSIYCLVWLLPERADLLFVSGWHSYPIHKLALDSMVCNYHDRCRCSTPSLLCSRDHLPA